MCTYNNNDYVRPASITFANYIYTSAYKYNTCTSTYCIYVYTYIYMDREAPIISHPFLHNAHVHMYSMTFQDIPSDCMPVMLRTYALE